MGVLEKLKPARSRTQEDFEIIADIDAVITKPIGFRLHGRSHKIRPVTTREFMEWSSALAHLWNLKKKEDVQDEEIWKAYYNVIHTLCETITLEDIQKCEPSQIAAIYGVLLDHVTGRIQREDEKKKALSQSTQNENLPN